MDKQLYNKYILHAFELYIMIFNNKLYDIVVDISS